MARIHLISVILVVTALQAVHAGVPLALPRMEMPNTTDIITSAKTALKSAASSVLASKVAMRPFKCPNGKPLVTCLTDVCPKNACAASELCVPDFCGQCGRKCVALGLPSLSVKMPALPSFSFSMPNVTALNVAQACALNQALNVTAVAASIADKDPRIACKDCPTGTVAKPPALSCTICPPGTFADRAVGSCKKCAAGTYSSSFGAAACKACPAGTFAPVSGLFACIKCPIGFAATAAGAVKCEYKGFTS